ncbi:MAG: hypothetical protein ACXAEN_20315 [Candidatus Thorarchaeota archaeon]|jgi:hypothetical protein
MRKPEESLTEYILRLEAFGASAGDQRVRIHPDYIDDYGNLLVKPVISYGAAPDGTVHEIVDSSGLLASANIYDEDHTMGSFPATVATEATIKPASPKIFYVYAIAVVMSASAAGRDFQPKWTDGSVEWPMTTATNIASGGSEVLWPKKEADNAIKTEPPFPCSNTYWIVIEDAMSAAETATIYAWYVHRSSEL